MHIWYTLPKRIFFVSSKKFLRTKINWLFLKMKWNDINLIYLWHFNMYNFDFQNTNVPNFCHLCWLFLMPKPKFRSWKNFNLFEGHCQLSDMARSWKLAFHYLDTWKTRPRINKSLHRLLSFERWGIRNVLSFDI